MSRLLREENENSIIDYKITKSSKAHESWKMFFLQLPHDSAVFPCSSQTLNCRISVETKSPLEGLAVPLQSAGWVVVELPGDCVAVPSDGVSWLEVGVSSTGQIMNHLFPVWRTANRGIRQLPPKAPTSEYDACKRIHWEYILPFCW